MRMKPFVRHLILPGVAALLVLGVAIPADAVEPPFGPSQFWQSPNASNYIEVLNITNDEYFAVALLYGRAGGFANCLGFSVPPHGGAREGEWYPDTNPDFYGRKHSYELFAVPTETGRWDRSGTGDLGVIVRNRKREYAVPMPPILLAPPTTPIQRLRARSCACEQIQCHEQDDDVLQRLGVRCGSVPKLDCDNRQWLEGECPACES